MASVPRDDNFIPGILVLGSLTGADVVVEGDETTKGMYVYVTGSDVATGGTSAIDDSAFTAGTSSGTPMMGFATADTIDSGDVGVVGMDTSRNLKISLEVDNVGLATSANQLADGHNVTVDNGAGASAVNIQDGGNSITVDGTVTASNTSGVAAHDAPVSGNPVLQGYEAKDFDFAPFPNAVDTEGDVVRPAASLFGVQYVTLVSEDGGYYSTVVTRPEHTLGTTTYSEGSTTGYTVGAVRNDTLATLVDTDNEIAPLQVSADGALYTKSVSESATGASAPSSATLIGGVGGAGVINAPYLEGGLGAEDVGGGNLFTTAIRLYDGATWDRARGDSTNGMLVNLGSNNDVDTELPSAVALADNVANPTSPMVGAALMSLDGVNGDWERVRSSLGDGVGAAGMPHNIPMMFNGASVDRLRGDSTNGMLVNLGANNDVLPSGSASTTGQSLHFDSDGDNTAQQVKASAGNVYSIEVSNPNSTDAYLQLFDVANGSITVGTTTPNQSFLVPAGNGTQDGAMDKTFTIPLTFSTAINYACTTTATGSTDPTTGLIVNIGYV